MYFIIKKRMKYRSELFSHEPEQKTMVYTCFGVHKGIKLRSDRENKAVLQ